MALGEQGSGKSKVTAAPGRAEGQSGEPRREAAAREGMGPGGDSALNRPVYSPAGTLGTVCVRGRVPGQGAWPPLGGRSQ